MREPPPRDPLLAAPEFTAAEIEAGRKLFAAEWRFVAAAGSLGVLPVLEGVEVAFAGRSNVGKSSLVNALTGRRALARISRTPGRTQELIFFSSGQSLRLVDLPGYGYAAAPKQKIAAWTGLIQAYIAGRANLARVYILIDARHRLKNADAPLLGPFLMLGAWPLVMGFTMWLQMKLNPAPPDPTQKMMMDWMPVIFTFMLASFSAGLVIYWAWNNLLSVIQQSIIMHKNGAKIELFDNLKSLFARRKPQS